MAHFKVFQIYWNLKYSSSHTGWPLYLSPQIMPIFFHSSHGLCPIINPVKLLFQESAKKDYMFYEEGFSYKEMT